MLTPAAHCRARSSSAHSARSSSAHSSWWLAECPLYMDMCRACQAVLCASRRLSRSQSSTRLQAEDAALRKLLEEVSGSNIAQERVADKV